MKKIILTLAVLFSTFISSNANETRMMDTITRLNNEISDSLRSVYDMNINKNIEGIRKYFLLDDEQKILIYDIQNGVENSFSTLNTLAADKREGYFENILKFWQKGAYNGFVATERPDAMKNYRRYWMCVNSTLKNRGYIDEYGRFINK